MFEDDDLDDLDLGLDPPPDPQLLLHFPGSPIEVRSLPLADSTSQVFNDGNRPILTSTQISQGTGKHSGLSSPQNRRPLGQQGLKTSIGPQTSTQRDGSNSQTSLASLPSQALSIIPKAAGAEKLHSSGISSSQGFRFKALSSKGRPMSRLSANNFEEGNEIDKNITPSSPISSVLTPGSPSYSPKSFCEESKSPVDSQQLSSPAAGHSSPNSFSTSQIEQQHQLSPSYSPNSSFEAHERLGTAERDRISTAPQATRNLASNTHTGKVPQIPDVPSVNFPSNPVSPALSACLPSVQPVLPNSIGDDMSANRLANHQRRVQPKPSEIESSLRRCSVLSETGLSIPSNSPPLDPSPPPRGTKRRFPGPAGLNFV